MPNGLLGSDNHLSAFLPTPLQRYFNVLRDPTLKNLFRTAYLKQLPKHTALSSILEPSEGLPPIINGLGETAQDPIDVIHHLRANLECEGIEAFGPWKIVFSNRTEGALREAAKKDRKKFKIYLKTIK